MTALKAGVIGLGNIGGGVAESLARAGLLAAVHDVRDEAVQSRGLPVANSASPRAVAEASDVVLIAVYDADQLDAVLEGPDGLFAAARRGLTLVVLSTLKRAEFMEFRSRALAHGVEMLDCGVTGGAIGAQSGTLVSLIGGEKAAVDAVRPVIQAFSKSVRHMGGPGCGMAGKIARNSIVFGVYRVEHEAFALARAAGVDTDALEAVLVESAANMTPPAFWATRLPGSNRTDVAESRREYNVSVIGKDLGAALELADEVGVDMPVIRISRATRHEMVGLPGPKDGE
jgi:3-hydroxyisobutyrate dehydrogenase